MDILDSIESEKLDEFFFSRPGSFNVVDELIYFFVESVQVFGSAILLLTLLLNYSGLGLQFFVESSPELSLSLFLLFLPLNIILKFHLLGLRALCHAANAIRHRVVIGTRSLLSSTQLLLILDSKVSFFKLKLAVDEVLKNISHFSDQSIESVLVLML